MNTAIEMFSEMLINGWQKASGDAYWKSFWQKKGYKKTLRMRPPSLGPWEKNEWGVLDEDFKVPVWGHNQGGEQQWLPVFKGTHEEADLRWWAGRSHLWRGKVWEGQAPAGCRTRLSLPLHCEDLPVLSLKWPGSGSVTAVKQTSVYLRFSCLFPLISSFTSFPPYSSPMNHRQLTIKSMETIGSH